MEKVSLIIFKICDWLVKYSIYTAIFLMPLFFLPWTADALDFNKQSLLLLLGFIALFLWMIKVLISGKFEINISKAHITVAALFLIYFFATVFSINKYGSFWGWPQSSSESLLSSIGFIIFYFLVSNVFSKESIFSSVKVFFISALFAEFIGILQLFGLFSIPFAFAKSTSFNTIGTAGSLGFFVAILLPLAIVMLVFSKKWWKILFGAQLILSIFILFSVNYPIIWWAVLIGSAFIIIFSAIKRNLFDLRWLTLPIFFLAVSLLFATINMQLPFPANKTNEIFLSQKTSLDISLQAIKEKPIFGSGPGTFSYNFLKFKNPSWSQTSLWNVTFNQATSKVLNDLTSTGILGIIALLAFMALPIFYGVKFLFFRKLEESENWVLAMGILASVITQLAVYFLYNSNFTLCFLNFFIIACLVNIVALQKKEYELKSSSFLTLAITFIFTLVFIFGVGLIILSGQRYAAEIKYFKGLTFLQAGNNEAGLKSLESAVSLNSSSDLFFRQLSQVYLLVLQKEINTATATPSDAVKNKIQILEANSVNAAKIATDINPKNSGNWANRGYIYQSLFGIIGDTSTWALTFYDEALKLDPNNPYLLLQEGLVKFITARSLGQDKPDQKSKLLAEAKDKLEKAETLNPNYSDALYVLGLVYDSLGQKNKAIEKFTKIQQLNPEDKTISKILSNLKAGFPALQQLTPIMSTPPATKK